MYVLEGHQKIGVYTELTVILINGRNYALLNRDGRY